MQVMGIIDYNRPLCVYTISGTYLITDTLRIPANTDIVGEMWSQILVKGSNFNDINNPRVALKFGNAGDKGYLRVSDIVVRWVFSSDYPHKLVC
jgi:hypothetical protein